MSSEDKIETLEVAAYKVPTETEEADGTLTWDATTMVVVKVKGGGKEGLGWSYASRAAGVLVEEVLKKAVVGRGAMAVEGAWREMVKQLRNVGTGGAGMMAVSAVDVALWDLKAKLLGVSLADLFGAGRAGCELYGSGGFTNYDDGKLARQLGGWAREGLRHVKMKVGRDAAADRRRAGVARKAIGQDVELFVDANGGYSRKVALQMAHVFREEAGVAWFEEPRPSDDLHGLRLLRDRGPAGMDIAAGEYGDGAAYFRRMIEAGAVDCLQADVTRCGGYTGFLQAAGVCDGFGMDMSAHCAPQLHAHVACAVERVRHVEYFFDHVRIEGMLFDGTLPVTDGKLMPDRSRAGHGMALKEADAERWRV